MNIWYSQNMTIVQLLNNKIEQKIGKQPVVVLPLKIWREIEEKLEDMAMERSKILKRKIIRARAQKKLYSAAEVKNLLKI